MYFRSNRGILCVSEYGHGTIVKRALTELTRQKIIEGQAELLNASR